MLARLVSGAFLLLLVATLVLAAVSEGDLPQAARGPLIGLFALLCAAWAYVDVDRGYSWLGQRHVVIRRAERPTLFWFVFAAKVITAAGALGVGLLALLHLH